jgi:hypothetical protein
MALACSSFGFHSAYTERTPSTRPPVPRIASRACSGVDASRLAKWCDTITEAPVLAASAARRDQGWQELAAELMPGTIGAELQELEETT